MLTRRFVFHRISRSAGGCLLVLLVSANIAAGQIPGVDAFRDSETNIECDLVHAANAELVVLLDSRELVLVSADDIILEDTFVDTDGAVFLDDDPAGSLRFAEDADGLATLWWLAFNGRVMATVPQLRSFISSIQPGQIVTIKYWRYDPEREVGERLSTTVKLERLDTIFSVGAIPPDQIRNELKQLGINAMETNTRILAQKFRAEYRAGVMITEITPDSMLNSQAEAGWTIVSVNDIPVRDIDEFFEALSSFDLRKGVILDLIDTEGKFHEATVGSRMP